MKRNFHSTSMPPPHRPIVLLSLFRFSHSVHAQHEHHFFSFSFIGSIERNESDTAQSSWDAVLLIFIHSTLARRLNGKACETPNIRYSCRMLSLTQMPREHWRDYCECRCQRRRYWQTRMRQTTLIHSSSECAMICAVKSFSGLGTASHRRCA